MTQLAPADINRRQPVMRLLAKRAVISLDHAGRGLQPEAARDRQLQDALTASNATLALCQQLSKTGHWRWQPDGDTVECSPELARLFGISLDQLPLGFAHLMAHVHPDDQAQVENAILDALFGGTWPPQQYRVMLSDGSVRHLQGAGAAQRNRRGQLEFLGTAVDITERKQVEEALRQAQAELARVARVTTMGQFAASIAHEVQQPLAAIVLHAQAGLNCLSQTPPNTEQAGKALSKVMQAGSTACDVVRSIRGMARNCGPEPTTFLLDHAIREVLLLLRSELQKHGVLVSAQLALPHQALYADRVQLQQVLMNLLVNAIEAMSGVSDRPRMLAVSSMRADASGTLRISVEDSGSGIDSHCAERLFDPLFSTKRNGMGMGLAICRAIVEAHGGRIWSASRQPHGTAFHVSLPSSARPA